MNATIKEQLINAGVKVPPVTKLYDMVREIRKLDRKASEFPIGTQTRLILRQKQLELEIELKKHCEKYKLNNPLIKGTKS